MKKVIRKQTLNISYMNEGKKKCIDKLIEEANRISNKFIEDIWFDSSLKEDFTKSFILYDYQQLLFRKAKQVVQTAKGKKKSMPQMNRGSLDLMTKHMKVTGKTNSFDIWFNLSKISKDVQFYIPSKKFDYLNKYLNGNWTQMDTSKIRKVNGNYFLDIYFCKYIKEKSDGKSIGVDIGIKKLIIDSDNKIYDTGLEECYNKIIRKKQGSKSFKKSLKERDNKINESINKIDLKDIKCIFIEDLKDIKKGKKNLRKDFKDKLLRWSYSKVYKRLSLLCDENGIYLIKVDPAYTSQTCSKCGDIYKGNRKGESYKCRTCGLLIDADYNASINILHRGLYITSA